MNKPKKDKHFNLKDLSHLPAKFKHYRTPTYIPCKIGEITNESSLTLSLPVDFYSHCNYFEDDPIVILIDNTKEIRIVEAFISKMHFKENTLELRIENLDIFSNRRNQNRFPTSIFTNLNGKHEMEIAYISNISDTGIRIISNAGLEKGEVLDIEAEINETPVFFKAKVVWTKELPTLNEFGLETIICRPDIQKIITLLQEDFKGINAY